MIGPVLPRLFFCLGLIAVLLLGGVPTVAAAPASPQWKAVLVAGDDAEPVFDNAVAAFAHWLVGHGVPTADIHRLSAQLETRDPAIEPASASRVLYRISNLEARPGQRCLVFVTSHGKRDAGVWLSYRREFLTPAALARAVSLGCAAVPTVVIVSSCYSGGFAGEAMQAPNRIILTAARADRPSFGCQADRTYTIFDECLLGALPRDSTWRATFTRDLACVDRREKWLNVLPSHPQGFFGAAVRDLAIR